MPAGLQVFGPNGEIVLDLTDRLFSYVLSGSAFAPTVSASSYYTSGVFVTIAGMTVGQNWVVEGHAISATPNTGILPDPVAFEIRNGGFYARSPYPTATIWYSVYRC